MDASVSFWAEGIRQRAASQSNSITNTAAPIALALSLRLLVVAAVAILLGVVSWFTYFGMYHFFIAPPASLKIQHPLHFAFPDRESVGVYPIARVCVRQLTGGQQYDYHVNMNVPESPVNFNVGLFMLRLFFQPSGVTSGVEQDGLASRLETSAAPNALAAQKDSSTLISERSVILKWKSPLSRTLYSLIYALPMSLGLSWFEEKQELRVELLHMHRYSGASDTQCMLLEINNPKFQVYEANLVITAKLAGLRYWCYHWYWTCLVLGTTTIFFVYCGIAMVVWLIYWMKSGARNDTLHSHTLPTQPRSVVTRSRWKSEFEGEDSIPPPLSAPNTSNEEVSGKVTQPEPEEASQEAAAGVGLLPDNSNSSDDESL